MSCRFVIGGEGQIVEVRSRVVGGEYELRKLSGDHRDDDFLVPA